MKREVSADKKSMEKSKEYVLELFSKFIESRDSEIRNQIFNQYMHIPEILSKKYVNKGVEFDDIYQVASLGLIHAIERFDPSKGYEFSTFATPTILGEIKKYFRDKEWLIKVPRRIQESYRKINQTKEELQHNLMRVPTIGDISEFLNISEEEVMEAMEGGYAYSPISLDTKINSKDDNDLSLLEILGMEDSNMLEIEDKDLVDDIFSKLNEYDKRFIVDRFFKNKSQSEIADDLQVSQMTVSRLEKKIINRLKETINI